jgi:two-component system, sensor histidine kinase
LLNVGLSLPYVPTITRLKIAVTVSGFLAIGAMYLFRVPDLPAWFSVHAYIISATAILGFVAYSFIMMVSDSFDRNHSARRTILRNQVALMLASQEVAQREQQARRLALIAENTGESIFVTDTENRIFWTNAAFSQITGYSLDEVTGLTPGDVLDAPGTDQATVRHINALRDRGQKGSVEILNRFKDGSLHWMSSSLNPVFDEQGRLTMCISVERDVTEEKKRVRELAEAHEQVKLAAQAKERFFATMSHEIRTPMNGVLGMTDLLSHTSLNAEQCGYLATIRESGQALLGIINDILDLSKLQSGTVQVSIAAFDLADVVQGVVSLLHPLAAAKDIALQMQAGTDNPIWVMGDGGRVRQVLMNLVGNAIKFTRDGCVTVRLERGPNDMFCIHVADTGIGITDDRLDAIFDSFTQADGDIDRQFGGTGLGLTISRMLARAMGGDVTAISEKGKGSTFTLSLLLQPAQPETPAATPVQDKHTARAFARNKRILVAEDNATNRLILRKMLEPTGALLTEVSNGSDAVAAYWQNAPDLVIMDMQMPVMDGLMAIRLIRQFEATSLLRRCPIMVLSANALQEDVDASYAADCDDYLTKPVLREALLTSTARLLAREGADQALPGALRLA